MKFYNDFNSMFNAQSGVKKDMSVFNEVYMQDSLVYVSDDRYSESYDPQLGYAGVYIDGHRISDPSLNDRIILRKYLQGQPFVTKSGKQVTSDDLVPKSSNEYQVALDGERYLNDQDMPAVSSVDIRFGYYDNGEFGILIGGDAYGKFTTGWAPRGNENVMRALREIAVPFLKKYGIDVHLGSYNSCECSVPDPKSHHKIPDKELLYLGRLIDERLNVLSRQYDLGDSLKSAFMQF